MKKSIVLLLIGVFFIGSCKSDKKVEAIEKDSLAGAPKIESTNIKVEKQTNKNEVDDEATLDLFNPCDFISTDQIASILNIDEDAIKIKNVSRSGKYSNSCFLTWENVENGSKNRMFLMLQSNPLPGEFEDWSKAFIEAKIENGDMGYPDNGKPYKYKKVDGFGEDVAYSDELKRIFWRVDGDYVFAIYYNAGLTSTNRQKFSKSISEIMNKNFRNKK